MRFRDLNLQYSALKDKIDNAVLDVMASADFIGGEPVNLIEKRLAEYTGVKHCISCGNGTDALVLALMALDVRSFDAVFVPDFTFFASAEVISFMGAHPIFVDVDEKTFNISPEALEKAVVNVLNSGRYNPRAVIAVDLFGLPADFMNIKKIAEKYNLTIIEDGAQGFGGSIDVICNREMACSFGDIATTSFFPAKPLGCYGDGGAVFTNNDEWAEKIESFKVHGKGTDKYDNIRIGMNSRLDAIQAAILNVKLDAFIDYELKDVNKAAEMYNERLEGIVKIPEFKYGFYSSRAQYTITLEDETTRNGLKEHLNSNGIPTMIYFNKPMHKQKAFSHLTVPEDELIVSDKLCKTVLSLPIHPYLTAADVDLVSNCIKDYFKTK